MSVLFEGLQEVFGTAVVIGGGIAGLCIAQYRGKVKRDKDMQRRIDAAKRKERRQEAVRFADQHGIGVPAMHLVYNNQKAR